MVGSSLRIPWSAPGQADLGQASAEHALPHDEGGAPRGAGLLTVVVREKHALVGNPVDVRRPVAHHAFGVGADVGLADVVTPDDQDVRLLVRRRFDPWCTYN